MLCCTLLYPFVSVAHVIMCVEFFCTNLGGAVKDYKHVLCGMILRPMFFSAIFILCGTSDYSPDTTRAFAGVLFFLLLAQWRSLDGQGGGR